MQVFTRHKLKKNPRAFQSKCEKFYQCSECGYVISSKLRPKHLHRCHEVRCFNCNQYCFLNEHRCYMTRLKAPRIPIKKRLIFFDFKTDISTAVHVANFCMALYEDSNEVFVFKGQNTVSEFTKWLFQGKHRNCIGLAHNMGRFDGVIVLDQLLYQGVTPNVINRLGRYLQIKTSQIRMQDSINYINAPLKDFVSIFDLDASLSTGYFPHLANNDNFANYCGPLLPSAFYDPDSMKTADRNDFLIWHSQNRNMHFDFQTELHKYTLQDVNLLKAGCLAFRKYFVELTGLDVFESVTLPSACMKVFRTNFMPEQTIPIDSPSMYVNRTNASKKSLQYFEYIARKRGIYLQTARSPLGEFKIGRYSVDAYYAPDKLVMSFHGCMIHGCPVHTRPDDIHPFYKIKMSDVHAKTLNREAYYQSQGYKTETVWEHTFDELRASDIEFKRLIDSSTIISRLNMRDSLYGGRVTATKLLFQCDEYDENCLFYDFISLYPSIQADPMCLFPKCHPDILVSNLDCNDVSKYFGLIQCRIEPPSVCYMPYLPYRTTDKRLVFINCRTCYEQRHQGFCGHDSEQRSLIGTWCSEEIKFAVSMGYVVHDIFEVYHYSECTNNIFREYILTFIHEKNLASGWPENVRTDSEKETFMQDYLKFYGKLIDHKKMRKNAG